MPVWDGEEIQDLLRGGMNVKGFLGGSRKIHEI